MNADRRGRRARLAEAWEARRRGRRAAVEAAEAALDAARRDAEALALRRDAWAGRAAAGGAGARYGWEAGALEALDARIRGARALEELRAFELHLAAEALREAGRRLRAIELLIEADALRERAERRRVDARVHDDLARRPSALGKVS